MRPQIARAYRARMSGPAQPANGELLHAIVARHSFTEAGLQRLHARIDNVDAKFTKLDVRMDGLDAKVDKLRFTIDSFSFMKTGS